MSAAEERELAPGDEVGNEEASAKQEAANSALRKRILAIRSDPNLSNREKTMKVQVCVWVATRVRACVFAVASPKAKIGTYGGKVGGGSQGERSARTPKGAVLSCNIRATLCRCGE